MTTKTETRLIPSELMVTLEVTRPMNQPQYFDLRVNGVHIANIWGTAKVYYHKDLGQYHVVVDSNNMTACDAMLWVDKITKRDDYEREAIAEAKGETK